MERIRGSALIKIPEYSEIVWKTIFRNFHRNFVIINHMAYYPL